MDEGQSNQVALADGRSGSEWKSPYFAGPAGLGLAAGAAVLVFGAGGVVDAASAAILLIVAAGAGHLLHCAHFAELRQKTREVESCRTSEPSRLRELCLQLFPIWARQIRTSREIVEQEIANLTTSFSDMVDKLGATLATSRRALAAEGAGDRSIVSIISRSEAELGAVVGTLRELQQNILSEVTSYAAHLQDMAYDVRQIALQIRLLALNGSIEAARSGEAGKTFGVVVAEMQRLSNMSAEMGARISKRVETVNGAIAGIFSGAGQGAASEASLIDKAGQDLENVMRRFRGLTTDLSDSMQVMERDGEVLRDQISDALVALQFQDRISQIMAHVIGNVEKLHDAIVEQAEDARNIDAWLDEMEHAYSVPEEFANLRGESKRHHRPSGVTYF